MNENGSLSKFRRKERYKYEYGIDDLKVAEEFVKESKNLRCTYRRFRRNEGDIYSGKPSSCEGPLKSIKDMDPEVPHTKDAEMEGANVDVNRSEEGSGDGEKIFIRTRPALRSKGITETGERKKSKRKRRERTDSTKLKLMDYVPARERKGGVVLLSDSENLVDAFRIGTILRAYMKDHWVEVPHLRCVHVKVKIRKMIYVSSTRLKMLQSGGGCTEKPSIALMVQDSRREVTCMDFDT